MNIRVGFGYDMHRLQEGRELWMGGVKLDHPLGLQGHSDADVLIHAICDALLGAAGLGDIGQHFPDTDPRWCNADSRDLLRRVLALLTEGGLTPANVDLTVLAQAPRIAPHVAAMRAHIAADLGLPEDRVNVKATTTEGLGFVGRREGIAVHAVALLREADND
jgi:2-C-methyl-D-erythritol 2,4-cyclodiphosphate synthase